jgi:16S rRNA (adenine(1408)-N(1))-methyltransferase
METIRGRKTRELDWKEFRKQIASYERILLDLGTGDGRYAHTLAERYPSWFVIGVDACRENLHRHSQAKLPNILFIIASAQSLPDELESLISHVTINFPWGSLLRSLLTGDPSLLCGLERMTRAEASMDLHLNAGALTEAGSTLEAGAHTIYNNLRQAGWLVKAPALVPTSELRAFPSTWAKRLTFGRDPRAIMLSAQK